MYRWTYDFNRPWKEVMEDLADDDPHEEFYDSWNPLVRYLHKRRIAIIRDLIQLRSPQNALEIGCGDGFVLEAIANLGVPLTGVEISEKRIARARTRAPRATILQGDATSLKLPSGGFDLTICTEVLEHIPDPVQAIAEIKRVTRKDGWAIVTVPNERNWRIGRSMLLRFPIGIPDHVNQFSVSKMNSLFGMEPEAFYCLPPVTWLFCLTYVFIYHMRGQTSPRTSTTRR